MKSPKRSSPLRGAVDHREPSRFDAMDQNGDGVVDRQEFEVRSDRLVNESGGWSKPALVARTFLVRRRIRIQEERS